MDDSDNEEKTVEQAAASALDAHPPPECLRAWDEAALRRIASADALVERMRGAPDAATRAGIVATRRAEKQLKKARVGLARVQRLALKYGTPPGTAAPRVRRI